MPAKGKPELTWAQCEACDKWRKLPHLAEDQVPDEWYCSMNLDPRHDSCDIPEEQEDTAPALAPGQFEVEVLLARRRDPRTRRTQYKVRWKGYDSDEDSWEPAENFHPNRAPRARALPPPGAACACTCAAGPAHPPPTRPRPPRAPSPRVRSD